MFYNRISIMLFFTVTLLIGALGCQHQASENKSAGLRISQVIPKGVWINSRYLETLEKTKSLYAAQHSFLEDSTSSIDQIRLEDDSLETSYNLHEGGFRLPVLMIDSFHFIAKNVDDTAMVINGQFNKDYSVLTATENHNQAKQFGFRKGSNVYDFVIESFFSRNFLSFDSVGKFIDTVRLSKLDDTSWGTIQGLGGKYKKYLLNLDFNGPGMNLDQLDLANDDKDHRTFGWKMDHDTIFLYNLICTEWMGGTDTGNQEDCATFKNGEVCYKLLKITAPATSSLHTAR